MTVTFRPSPNGSTVVEVHQVGLPDPGAQASHRAGWTGALEGLDRTLHRSLG